MADQAVKPAESALRRPAVASSKMDVGPAQRVEDKIGRFIGIVTDGEQGMVDDSISEETDERLVEAAPGGAGSVEDGV
jgi:hypothetical protein